MLLSAKPYVEKKITELKERVSVLVRKPKLAIIQVEGNPASDKYVNNKMKRCAEVGIDVRLCYYGKDVDFVTLAEKIMELNTEREITGILLQLPLPDNLKIYTDALISQITPHKDVDGLTTENIGRLSQGLSCIKPCTPKGIIDLLEFYNIPIEGRDVLIINRSDLVGKPLAQLFLQKGATVTITHSKTRNLHGKIFRSDIVVTGVGISNFLADEDFIGNTTIVDVSINFENGKMRGDIVKEDYDILAERCNLTPVPGGVGQTTVIALLDTLVELAEMGF